jgi:hypothetical protein
MIILIICWIILGIHSIYFFIKRARQYDNITTDEIPILLICMMLPIVTHIITSLSVPNKKIKEPKILFKKSIEL